MRHASTNMAHQVFISHAIEDGPVVAKACALLEAAGIRCWLASRDIQPGAEWDEAIVEAIEQCSVLVLMVSAKANESAHVRRELRCASDRGSTIIPVRIDATPPSRALSYYLSGIHWIDAPGSPVESLLERLVESVARLLSRRDAGAATPLAAEPAISRTHRRPSIVVDTLRQLAAVGDTVETKAPVPPDLFRDTALGPISAFAKKVMKLQGEHAEVTWPYGLRPEWTFECNILGTGIMIGMKALMKTVGPDIISHVGIVASLVSESTLHVAVAGGGRVYLIKKGELLLLDVSGSVTAPPYRDPPDVRAIDHPLAPKDRWLLWPRSGALSSGALEQPTEPLSPVGGAADTTHQVSYERLVGLGVIGTFHP